MLTVRVGDDARQHQTVGRAAVTDSEGSEGLDSEEARLGSVANHRFQ